MDLTKRLYFDAAHRLPDSQDLVTKRCTRPHGHTYALTVKISADNFEGSMIVDFGRIKTVVDRYDHTDLNAFLEIPTAENILVMLAEDLQRMLAMYTPHARLAGLALAEGYKGEADSSWVLQEF